MEFFLKELKGLESALDYKIPCNTDVNTAFLECYAREKLHYSSANAERYALQSLDTALTACILEKYTSEKFRKGKKTTTEGKSKS